MASFGQPCLANSNYLRFAFVRYGYQLHPFVSNATCVGVDHNIGLLSVVTLMLWPFLVSVVSRSLCDNANANHHPVLAVTGMYPAISMNSCISGSTLCAD